jgi:hypothetical protein
MVAENMVQSVNSLLTLSNSLKLMFLLSDQKTISDAQKSVVKELSERTNENMKKVGEELGKLLHGSNEERDLNTT